VLATTNRDLAGKWRRGASVKTCTTACRCSPGLASLRERPADILPLAERLLARHVRKMKHAQVRLSPRRRLACRLILAGQRA
jgi:two-component system response regulator FlrC